MTVLERTFQQVALEDPSGGWELYCGELRQKPPMTADHNRVSMHLCVQLANQLDDTEFTVRNNSGHVRHSPENYYVPDVFVIPIEYERPFRGKDDILEAYDAP